MQIFTTEKDYLPRVADMKDPYDLIRFNLELVSFDDVLAAIRAQYPNHRGLALYKHGNTIAIQQCGGDCGMGVKGVSI